MAAQIIKKLTASVVKLFPHNSRYWQIQNFCGSALKSTNNYIAATTRKQPTFLLTLLNINEPMM